MREGGECVRACAGWQESFVHVCASAYVCARVRVCTYVCMCVHVHERTGTSMHGTSEGV